MAGTLLLAGLPEEYKPMIMGIVSSRLRITGDSIKVKLLQENVYAACVYVRSINQQGTILVNILCAKSKVALLKSLTIPRLELCAAHLTTKLLLAVKESVKFEINQTFMWCDSTIVLGWLNTQPHLLKVFVAHRIADIQSKTADASWHHVLSKDNPADLGSRGILPTQLNASVLWWHGPCWLSQPTAEWPNSSNPMAEYPLPELKRIEISCPSLIVKFPLNFSRFSNYNRLLRTLAYCLRFTANCRKLSAERINTSLTVTELERAEQMLVKSIQAEEWHAEINQLAAGKTISPKSKILCLSPFLDKGSVMRVGGMLQASNLKFERKHQMLLPKHAVTELMFKYYHLKMNHSGPQLLLCSIRSKFWPLGARNYARTTVHKCMHCIKCKPVHNQPLMGNLPSDRINPSLPFKIVGVDYAGLLLIKDRKGRGCQITKCYIAVFVCLAIKAVYIELVSSLNTDAFLPSLRRFISRREKPCKIYSDNGTNFVGAQRELANLYALLNDKSDDIAESLSVDGITCSFIPPNAPNFGGLWEAAIKSILGPKRPRSSYSITLPYWSPHDSDSRSTAERDTTKQTF